MKQIFTILAVSGCLLASAQEAKKDTSYWKTSGFFGLNFSNTQQSDWQGGVQNNLAVNGIINLEAKFKKDKQEWINKFDGQLGFIKTEGLENFKKNIDQIFALSKYNLNAFSKYWFYAAQLDYRSQFSPGYKYDGQVRKEPAVSDFNSPGYTQIAIGLDFKPTNYFSATFAPIAGKITTVNRQYLADEGAFGVVGAVKDANENIITPGKRMRSEFGGRVILKFKKDLVKNVNLDSYLDLFSNYTNNPGNIDVVFNNLLTIKLNKYFTATLISQMIYDDDIIRVRDLNNDEKIDASMGEFSGPRLQLLTTFGIGFGYKF